MKGVLSTLVLVLAAASAAAGGSAPKVYKWVDPETGKVYLSDKVPPEAAEMDKSVVNVHGVEVGKIDGRKTEEELLAEQREQERMAAIEAQRRADQALLNTYLTIEEIMLHRDRRVELWQAQSRVTELYLRNLEKRLDTLAKRANNFDDSVPQDLQSDIIETRNTIARHERNLEDYKEEEQEIRARFDGDIQRFKQLKGLQ